MTARRSVSTGGAASISGTPETRVKVAPSAGVSAASIDDMETVGKGAAAPSSVESSVANAGRSISATTLGEALCLSLGAGLRTMAAEPEGESEAPTGDAPKEGDAPKADAPKADALEPSPDAGRE